jgi:polynucleotide kinase-phosphatase
MTLTIPELSLVVLIGPSGCGKSTFARRHFKPTEVLSSDAFRALVSDDENDQSSTDDAFAALHFVGARRLAKARLTVVDATNVQPEARKPLVALAREYHVLPVAIVFDLPERVCHERNRSRPDRDFGPHVVRNQRSQLHRSLRGLGREGFRHVHVLKSQDEVDAAVIERQPLWNNRKQERGPFDVIGDVHGCCDELEELLRLLGYAFDEAGVWRHADGRKAVFVGDLVDRGPRVVDTLKTVIAMVRAGAALCVPGNHDIKLKRKLEGRDVNVAHGLDRTLAELDQQTSEFRQEVRDFMDGLVSHYVFDDGRLVVAHAGMKEEMQGRGSGKVRDFAMYGETTGETDQFGLPVRYNWAAEYRGRATVVYGHTPVPEPDWLNRTINIDTGCVFGGRLTALRWPEKELVSVGARQTYADPIRPLVAVATPALTAQHAQDDLLDIEDVRGKRLVTTRLHRTVTIREENAAAALEVMSRFAANPKWLIYLPPTMSPTETAKTDGLLEHPAEAFSHYRANGVSNVVVEQKHMGSRAIVIVCRNRDVARERFGVLEDEEGICYTRTGRRFFEDSALERELIATVRDALDRSGFWERLNTNWMCLDCELMPWSAKALELVRQQYAAVGAAARISLGEAADALEQAAGRGIDVGELLARQRLRQDLAGRFAQAYRHYCWPVESLRDIRIAPFHVMATEGIVHADKDHVWHMDTISSFVDAQDPLLMTTPYHVVDLTDVQSEASATEWWTSLTESGGEGAVVKPKSFVVTGSRGLLQPAIKCRGREYLRIIYGPEYTLPEHLSRLRERGLSAKRSLALREFALGIEALERFVQKEPLRRVHECVFGVLALESEPVDPRL